jgi:hypothetical protein
MENEFLDEFDDIISIGMPENPEDLDEIQIPTGTWIDKLDIILDTKKYIRPSLIDRDTIMLANWADIESSTTFSDTGTWIDEYAF